MGGRGRGHGRTSAPFNPGLSEASEKLAPEQGALERMGEALLREGRGEREEGFRLARRREEAYKGPALPQLSRLPHVSTPLFPCGEDLTDGSLSRVGRTRGQARGPRLPSPDVEEASSLQKLR